MEDSSSRLQIDTVVSLFGMSFAPLDELMTTDIIMMSLASGSGGWICTVNTEILRQYQHNIGGVRTLFDQADFIVADGAPLVWASRLQGTPLPGRVAGSSLLMSLTHSASEHGRSIYLLGGNPGAAAQASTLLHLENPQLRVAGWHCPPFGFENDASELQTIRRSLTDAQPDIVFVGLGFPKQERLIVSLRKDLPAAWFIPCGISFSFAAGAIPRAPRLLQVLGLEWAHRLVQEPRRLFARYVVYDIPFAFRLMVTSALKRLSS
jgi:N-acetylglucosaminyldiphosphoundecaprenol N-acetyl-beta-D-mannosaminyltransferase